MAKFAPLQPGPPKWCQRFQQLALSAYRLSRKDGNEFNGGDILNSVFPRAQIMLHVCGAREIRQHHRE
jgi:hypothetical protein